MYQFTTTNIINSSLDSNGTTAKYAGAAGYFKVARVGTFLKDNIVSVTKRAYYAGVLEQATITIVNTGVTAGDVLRLEIDVRLSMQTDSEYANTYLYFKKPVVVEVIATGTAATDAAALKTQINALKDRFGFSYVTATVSSATITLTATNVNQRFYSITQKREAWASTTIITPEYVSIATGSVSVPGRIGFGDDDWMQRKIMLQTLDNTRYFGLSKDERPVLGGNYTEYVLRYSLTKDGTDGIVGGGTSITTHVFYVKSDLVSAFETALLTVTDLALSFAGPLTITTPSAWTVAEGGNTLDLGTTGEEGTVTWSTSNATVAAINSSTGVITTGTDVITADTEVTITAVDQSGQSTEQIITVTNVA